MENIKVFLLIGCVCGVVCVPLDASNLEVSAPSPAVAQPARAHTVQRRFINPLFSLGTPDAGGIANIRTKRSYDECEKLQLCKLHARSHNNFISAFELYFVNKENARLWDHQARSKAECERRFGDCYNK